MKISIITVCFNAKATIADAMESVAKQRVENVEEVEIEHIVVDGGSTDGTVEIIREFANNQVKVRGEGEGFAFRWISEKDNGLYDAMNKGIKMATGDVVGILNADDMMAADDVLLKIAERFEKDPGLEFLYSGAIFLGDIHLANL